MAACSSSRPLRLSDPGNVPGALPRTPNRGAVTLAKLQTQQPQQSQPMQQPQSEPAVVASVPMPHPAPQPKQGEAPAQQEKPTSIAGLIGNLFGGSKSEAAPVPPAPQKEQVARSNDLAAKPRQAAPVHTASTPVRAATPPSPVRTASAGSSPWPSEPAPGPRQNQPQRRRLHRSLLRFSSRPKSRRRVRKSGPPIRPRLRATTACSPVPSRWSPLARSRARWSGTR